MFRTIFLYLLPTASLLVSASPLKPDSHTTIKFIDVTTPEYLKNDNVAERVTKIGIYPYIAPNPASKFLRVVYVEEIINRTRVQEDGGDCLTDYQTRNEPVIILRDFDCDVDQYYALFMTFIQIPNSSYNEEIQPERLKGARQYHHLLRYNILDCEMDNGVELFKYKPPLEMIHDEYRLYVFLLFKQNSEIDVDLEERYRFYFFRDEHFHDSHRKEFTVQDFVDYYDIGELYAANFFHQRFPSLDFLF